ncbi:MAG: hypothetical protein ABSA78_12975 [Candidatus Sulfotelmatobacter sp.]|jgi:hypothetical protein
MIYQEPFVYRDQQGQPLMGGTAIEDRTTLVHHQGIIAYRDDVQIVLESSLRHGGAVEIPAIEFNGGKIVSIVRTPRSPAAADVIVQRAWGDVQRGVKWSLLNNCQDFVSRAYEGKNGSKTRDIVVVGGLAAAALIALS